MAEHQIIDRPCKKCGARPASYTRYHASQGAGFNPTCDDCQKKYKSAWLKDRKRRDGSPRYKLLERPCSECGVSPSWFENHPTCRDGYRRKCVECMAPMKAAYRKKHGPALRAYFEVHGKEERESLKREVLGHYGGACFCCGETDIRFLTLDHKDNDGAMHRKQVRAMGLNMYRWARKRKFPKGLFQVACFNCNCARQFRGNGICPHEEDRRALLNMAA